MGITKSTARFSCKDYILVYIGGVVKFLDLISNVIVTFTLMLQRTFAFLKFKFLCYFEFIV